MKRTYVYDDDDVKVFSVSNFVFFLVVVRPVTVGLTRCALYTCLFDRQHRTYNHTHIYIYLRKRDYGRVPRQWKASRGHIRYTRFLYVRAF